MSVLNKRHVSDRWHSYSQDKWIELCKDGKWVIWLVFAIYLLVLFVLLFQHICLFYGIFIFSQMKSNWTAAVETPEKNNKAIRLTWHTSMAGSLIWRCRDCKVKRFTCEVEPKWSNIQMHFPVTHSFGTYNLARACPFILNYRRSIGK